MPSTTRFFTAPVALVALLACGGSTAKVASQAKQVKQREVICDPGDDSTCCDPDEDPNCCDPSTDDCGSGGGGGGGGCSAEGAGCSSASDCCDSSDSCTGNVCTAGGGSGCKTNTDCTAICGGPGLCGNYVNGVGSCNCSPQPQVCCDQNCGYNNVCTPQSLFCEAMNGDCTATGPCWDYINAHNSCQCAPAPTCCGSLQTPAWLYSGAGGYNRCVANPGLCACVCTVPDATGTGVNVVGNVPAACCCGT
jgi:hypothetical protein